MYKWELLNESGDAIVVVGDEVISSRGEKWTVSVGRGSPPHKPSSTGRIWVEDSEGNKREYFPSVFDCKWEYVEVV